MTVAAQPAQCQDASDLTEMNTRPLMWTERSTLFLIVNTCEQVEHKQADKRH